MLEVELAIQKYSEDYRTQKKLIKLQEVAKFLWLTDHWCVFQVLYNLKMMQNESFNGMQLTQNITWIWCWINLWKTHFI